MKPLIKEGPDKIQSLWVLLQAITAQINTNKLLCPHFQNIYTSTYIFSMFYYSDQDVVHGKASTPETTESVCYPKQALQLPEISSTSFLSFQTLQTSHIALLHFIAQYLTRPFEYVFLDLSWLSPQCTDDSRTDRCRTQPLFQKLVVCISETEKGERKKKKSHTFKVLHLIVEVRV